MDDIDEVYPKSYIFSWCSKAAVFYGFLRFLWIWMIMNDIDEIGPIRTTFIKLGRPGRMLDCERTMFCGLGRAVPFGEGGWGGRSPPTWIVDLNDLDHLDDHG